MSLFSDIWHDLREKRMWPLAAALLAALIAVPLVLAKPAEEADTSSTAATPAPPAADPKVELALNGPQSSGSGLDVFSPADPFRPPASVLGAMRNEAGSSISSTLGSLGAGASDGGGSGGGGDKPAGGSGSGGGSSKPAPKIEAFVYVADVTFGRAGRTRAIRGLRKFDMLPDSDTPILVFLGVDSRGDNAVFLLDATVRQSGEGHCADSECSILAVGAGSEHGFVDQAGREYVLRIDQIRRVSAAQAAAARVATTTRGSSRDDESRAFLSDLLVDVTETVASTDAGASRSGRDSR